MAKSPIIQYPKPGRYVLAVSGGADSMVLLDLMAQAASAKKYDLVVAHFDHGLRQHSAKDLDYVKEHSKAYGLPFVSRRANLPDASEQTSRVARLAWLSQICDEQRADAVITAHHQDDLLETSLLNLARGTAHRGVAPMQNGSIIRPLLGSTREELRSYAKDHNISWREDPTNQNTDNPRNFLRHILLPTANNKWREKYLNDLSYVAKLNDQISGLIASLTKPYRVSDKSYDLPRKLIQSLSLPELDEVLSHIVLELDRDVEIDRRIISEISLFLKTSKPHRRRPVRKGLEVVVDLESAKVLSNQ